MKTYLILILLINLLLPAISSAAITENETIPFGEENEIQPPVLYIHGWNDDGTLWSRYDGSGDGNCTPDRNNINIEPSPSLFLERAGIQNWAVQWWSSNNGDAFSSSDEGEAFLSNAQQLINSTTPQEGGRNYSSLNRPCPSAISLIMQGNILGALDAKASNTYNDSGAVVAHATDLLEMLRNELKPGGKLADYKQVNIVTHSKGGLVARTMLSMAAANQDDYEFVANVIYNAPPFAGSSLGDMFAPFFGNEDPSIISILNNPFFKATFGTDTNTSVKKVFEQYISLLMITAGFPTGLDELRQMLPPGALIPLDLLQPFTLENIEDEIASLPPPNLFIPDFQVANNVLLKLIRDNIIAFTALPSRPALDDLMMDAAKSRLLTYPTSEFTPQFIIYGDYDPLNFPDIGAPSILFPCDILNNNDVFGSMIPCVSDIESDPNLLSADAFSMVPTNSDIAVSVGSARLLAETSRFGTQMKILAKKDAFHGDLTAPDVVGTDWLKALTAAPTNMLLEGRIENNLKDQRMYQVSLTTTFSLQSQTVNIRSSQRYPNHSPVSTGFEYRLVRNPGSDTETLAWVSYNEAEKISFSALNTQYDLAAIPFAIEWRSLNEKGGKEMIRAANFTLMAGVPKVVDSFILSPLSAEVYQRKIRNLRGVKATRSTFLTNNFGQALKNIIENPEAKWVISNQASKVLNIVLNAFGGFEYNWNETSLNGAPTTKLNGVQGAILPLENLTEGYNTLLYRTSSIGGQSPTQKLTIFVDNAPPKISFECKGVDSFTCLVGPDTLIRYTIHDVETNNGKGILLNFPLANINDGEFFSLAQTNLADAGIAAGVVGAPIDLTVRATDLVNNTKDEKFTIYYDWTAPSIEILANSELLPAKIGYRVFKSEVKLVVKVASENGGFDRPIADIIPAVGGVLTSSPFTLNGNGNYEAIVPLKPGKNKVSISTKDIVGNLGKTEITIYYSQINFDSNLVEIMSARVQDICYTASGVERICTLGNIENVVTSYHGDVVAFRSNGNRFVPNDLNASNAYDIFAWRDGVINLLTVTTEGVQADEASRSLAVSGNGRYVYFASTATNLINGAEKGNIFIKDMDTGELAVITRNFDGNPINHPQGILSPNLNSAATTYNGRYVFFVSHTFANGTVAYVDGLIHSGNFKQIYMVDLDPDENGSLFDDNYVTVPISNIMDVANGDANTALANGDSVQVSVSLDGKYLSFQTAATDIDSVLADNGNTRDIVLIEFAGSATDGTLEPSLANRKITVVAKNASLPKVAPNSDTVAFMQLNGSSFNIFASSRNTANDISNRTTTLISEKLSGGNSAGGGTILDVAIADDTVSTGLGHKVAWASLHNNIVAGDNNSLRDMFVYRESDPFPANLKVPNWIDDTQPSSSAVVGSSAILSGDGRYAFWVSQQEYFSPYNGDGERHLFRRRIDAPKESVLTIEIEGNGSVQRSSTGSDGNADNQFLYDDESRISLTAVSATGGQFLEWKNGGSTIGNTTLVSMAQDRTVIAVFANTNAPYNASASLTTNEDSQSAGVSPNFSDDDLNDVHTISITSQAVNGIAEVINNQLVYIPNENYVGNDSFQFQITDLSNLQLDLPATATVTVLPTNDRPLSTSADISTTKNQASSPTAPAVSDIDLDDVFIFQLVSQAQNGVVKIENNLLVYTPEQDFVGDDRFEFLAIDSGGLTVIGSALVKVNDVIKTNPVADGNTGKSNKKSSGSAIHPFIIFAIIGLLIGRICYREKNKR